MNLIKICLYFEISIILMINYIICWELCNKYLVYFVSIIMKCFLTYLSFHILLKSVDIIDEYYFVPDAKYIKCSTIVNEPMMLKFIPSKFRSQLMYYYTYRVIMTDMDKVKKHYESMYHNIDKEYEIFQFPDIKINPYDMDLSCDEKFSLELFDELVHEYDIPRKYSDLMTKAYYYYHDMDTYEEIMEYCSIVSNSYPVSELCDSIDSKMVTNIINIGISMILLQIISDKKYGTELNNRLIETSNYIYDTHINNFSRIIRYGLMLTMKDYRNKYLN